jgi:acyl dehydratase
MPLNVSLEGKAYPERSFVVDAERVQRFASALGAAPTSVPPTFATAAEFALFPEIVDDPDLCLDFSRVLHGEQDYEWRRPLRPGETLTVRSRLASIRHKAGNGFLTIETDLVDADGATVVRARATMIERGS